MEEEGPRRGFSLRVWNENLPKNLATQEVEFLGQLLTYMVTTKSAMFATTKVGTSHGNHRLNGLNSSPLSARIAGCCDDDVVAGVGSNGCTALAPRRGWTLISIWPSEDEVWLRTITIVMQNR